MRRTFDDLTLPLESAATCRRLLSAELEDRARALARLSLRGVDPSLARPLDALREVARAEARRRPGALLSALRRPTVGAPLRCLEALGPQGARATREPLLAALGPLLALELSAAGIELPPLDFVSTPDRLPCLGARRVLPGGGPARLRSGRWACLGFEGGLDAGDADAFRAVRGAMVLALADANPIAMQEAHPDKEGNAIDLGDRSPAEWCDALGEALDSIGRHLPLLRAEMDLVVQQWVPVGYHAERHLSASYREAVGTVYLTLHPRRATMIEALIHEFSHNKLNALLALDPILENPPDERHASPVRPDPRPLLGIVLAVHAFLPVAAFYRAVREAGDPDGFGPELAARLPAIISGNAEGLGVLRAHARPSAHGRRLLDEMERLQASFE